MRDWCSLPDQAIEVIAQLLPDDADYTRFRSVCTSWRAPTPTKPRLPWLILERLSPPYTPSDLRLPVYGAVKLLSHNRSIEICNFPATHRPTLLLPEDLTLGRFVCGCSRGWLALLHEDHDTPSLSLYNPFSNARIPLPLLTHLPQNFDGRTLHKSDRGYGFQKHTAQPFYMMGTYIANKLVLSSHPSDHQCVVMALCYNGWRLIHCRPGPAGDATSWTPLSPPFNSFFTDIVFYKGTFYAVCEYRVFVCDVGPHAKVEEIMPTALDPGGSIWPDKSYLVVSSGDLLLAAFRELSECVEVYRIEMHAGLRMKLVKMVNLGGRALFFSPNSMSVSTCAGDATWCKGNCIYYSYKDRMKPYSDTFIMEYNMEDGKTSVHTTISDDTWGAHWLTPSLC